MKRDWDLIAKILQNIENETLDTMINNASSEEEDLIYKHIELLLDCDYIRGYKVDRTAHGILAVNGEVRLTMSGYDLKEVLLDKNLFSKIKEKATSAGVKLSWEFIKGAIPFVYKSIM